MTITSPKFIKAVLDEVYKAQAIEPRSDIVGIRVQHILPLLQDFYVMSSAMDATEKNRIDVVQNITMQQVASHLIHLIEVAQQEAPETMTTDEVLEALKSNMLSTIDSLIAAAPSTQWGNA